MKNEAEIINKNKSNIFSPFCGAYLNLLALGNIDEFLQIIIDNLKCFEEKENVVNGNLNYPPKSNSSSRNNSFRDVP